MWLDHQVLTQTYRPVKRRTNQPYLCEGKLLLPEDRQSLKRDTSIITFSFAHHSLRENNKLNNVLQMPLIALTMLMPKRVTEATS
jgi:hypothetical protein